MLVTLAEVAGRTIQKRRSSRRDNFKRRYRQEGNKGKCGLLESGRDHILKTENRGNERRR